MVFRFVPSYSFTLNISQKYEMCLNLVTWKLDVGASL